MKILSQVRLVDAGFIWTEPHSRRIKVKLTVQKEVSDERSRHYFILCMRVCVCVHKMTEMTGFMLMFVAFVVEGSKKSEGNFMVVVLLL